jgi:NADH-quinone oxidoreductase subunit N
VSPETVYFLIPELVLVLVATLIYLGGAFAPGKQWSWVAVGGLIGAGFALWLQYKGLFWTSDAHEPLRAITMGGPISADLLGQYIRWLTLLVGLLFVLATWQPGADVPKAEYLGTLVMAVAGTMLVASARDMVLLFLGLELVSIPTYVLLYLGKRDVASQESTAKYFFLSILSSAIMLYGFSFLYGVSGSTDLKEVREALLGGANDLGSVKLLARVALVLVFAGLAFRITAVPFHFYAPDVYQGTTNGNAGLLSVLPKIVGFVALVRVLAVAMPGFESFGWRVALILAVLTMTLGNALALWQDNIRRMLAYSSIAHGGYMLIGLAVGFAAAGGGATNSSLDGLGALFFYLLVYAVATTGTFAALHYLGTQEKQVSGVDDLAGLGRTHPWAAIGLAVFMFSLAGIPPLSGFWGKFALFGSALSVQGAAGDTNLGHWFLGLAIIGALNAAVAAAYYLRIVSVMYFRAPVSTLRAQGGSTALVATLASAVLVIILGLTPSPFLRASNAASQSAYATPASVEKTEKVAQSR